MRKKRRSEEPEQDILHLRRWAGRDTLYHSGEFLLWLMTDELHEGRRESGEEVVEIKVFKKRGLV